MTPKPLTAASLQDSLAELPPALAQGMAARAALRTLPLLDVWLAYDEAAAMPTVLPTLRPLATAWTAALEAASATGPAGIIASADLGLLSAAIDAAVKQATRAVSLATSVVAHTEANEAFAYARMAFSAAVRAAYAFSGGADRHAATRAIAHIAETINDWPSIAADLDLARKSLSEEGGLSGWLAQTPLWLDAKPDWADPFWEWMKDRLLKRPRENWQVWTDWYDARLDPSIPRPGHQPVSLEREKARVLLPEAVWNTDAITVNREIARIVSAAEA